jgi:putative sterol carrier protein
MHRFPSEGWTEAYKNAINYNLAFHKAAETWTFGFVALIVQCDVSLGLEQDTGVILDVHEGKCRDARFVKGHSRPSEAEFVTVGSYQQWKDIIERRLDPTKAMIEGRLRLARGHLPTLIRFREASRELAASARRVPTEFLV